MGFWFGFVFHFLKENHFKTPEPCADLHQSSLVLRHHIDSLILLFRLVDVPLLKASRKVLSLSMPGFKPSQSKTPEPVPPRVPYTSVLVTSCRDL